MRTLDFPAVYLTGAAGYGALEILWRGWTHWTMLAIGGLCLCVMYALANRTRLPRWQMWVLSAAFITTAEFLSGVVVNILLGWRVWDYTAVPGNLLGQICPIYCLLWLGLSIPGISLCRRLRGLFR